MDRILIDSGPSPLSLHRIALFLLCPMLYALTYIAPPEKRLSSKRRPFVRGGLAHVGAAHHYMRMMQRQQGKDPDEYYTPAEAIELRAATLLLDHPQQMVDHEKRTALAMLDAYAKYEPVEMDSMEILAVEQVVYFELTHPFTGMKRWYTQRIDLLYREKATAKKIILDHKSTASHNVNTFSGFAPSLQMQGFRWWGPQLFGGEYGGVKVNVLGAEPPYKVERRSLPGAPMLVRRFPTTVLDAETAIERLIAEGRPYDQWPPASNELVCVHRYGRCEAWEPCLWGREPPQNGLVQFGARPLGLAPGQVLHFGSGEES